MPDPIYVTQPTLPSLAEFMPYLEKIWARKVLTNGGPFHQELEARLCAHLGVEHLSLFCNGTIALITALQALDVKGEVITTPYSFVATAHSLLWNRIEPVFVDIDPRTLNINANKIERAITEKTTAIMPVHCYGQPCDVDAIDAVAQRYGLKVIYDAAHAFGVRCHCGTSVLRHGDLSVLSLHATKVFNTFEGGAIISKSAEMKRHIDNLKNFGFENETSVVEAGINGKMNEVCAAFGLLQLEGLSASLASRKAIDTLYRERLKDVTGIECVPTNAVDGANYGYFPVLVKSSFRLSRDELYAMLRDNNIYARRYFYPLISDFPMYRERPSANPQNLLVAKQAADEVLCLPIYPGLQVAQVETIVDLIRGV